MNTLLSKKNSEVLTLFKFFFKRIEYNMNKYIQIRINNDIEYFNENFMNYIAKRNIRFELIIVKNFQINDNIERFN